MNLPTLLIVTGRPGSGKTTLAQALAREWHAPLVSRDQLMEGYRLTTGEPGVVGGPDARHVFDAFADAVTLLLGWRISLVCEAAFQHKVWHPLLERWKPRASVRVIVCQVDPTEARRRCVARGLADPNRERFHGDPLVRAAREGREMPVEPYDPPQDDAPTMFVDTTADYRPTLAEVLAFASEA
ncbi:MAG: AAA family ATPase [Tepidisphaeraceae bacterium]